MKQHRPNAFPPGSRSTGGSKRARYLVDGALIGALYALLTFITWPIGSGLMQCRLSEAMCILPVFTPAAIPGLFVGCLLSNLLAGALLYDVIFGSLATLLASVCTFFIAKHIKGKRLLSALAPLPAVVINALVIGALLRFVYALPGPITFFACVLSVGAGQVLACYGLGIPLLLFLYKNKGAFGWNA